MIIKTERSAFGVALDALLTTAGWAGFFYLFTRGVVSILDGTYVDPQAPMLEPFRPSAITITMYLLVAAFNASLVVLWGRYNKIVLNGMERAAKATQIEDEVVASHFQLSGNQLLEIQDSRVTVIYHSNDGDIAHLETDQLRALPAGARKPLEAVRVA